jgi:hypothetical protein
MEGFCGFRGALLMFLCVMDVRSQMSLSKSSAVLPSPPATAAVATPARLVSPLVVCLFVCAVVAYAFERVLVAVDGHERKQCCEWRRRCGERWNVVQGTSLLSLLSFSLFFSKRVCY